MNDSPKWLCFACGKDMMLFDDGSLRDAGDFAKGYAPDIVQGGMFKLTPSPFSFYAAGERGNYLGCICDDCIKYRRDRLHKVEVFRRQEWREVGGR